MKWAESHEMGGESWNGRRVMEWAESHEMGGESWRRVMKWVESHEMGGESWNGRRVMKRTGCGREMGGNHEMAG
jgi:hypothetical protein